MTVLNDLILHDGCSITTATGAHHVGRYDGVETVHGEWAALVFDGTETLSIPVRSIDRAYSDPGGSLR